MLKTEGQLLFPGPEGGRQGLEQRPEPLVHRAVRRGRIRRISSHGARHTPGSSYALAGASQKLIATMLGHSDTDATARYTHVQVEATAPVVPSAIASDPVRDRDEQQRKHERIGDPCTPAPDPASAQPGEQRQGQDEQ